MRRNCHTPGSRIRARQGSFDDWSNRPRRIDQGRRSSAGARCSGRWRPAPWRSAPETVRRPSSESSFYNEATANQRKNAFLTSPQARVFLKTVTDDENAHVKALKKVLGKHAIKKPKFDFHGDNASQAKFLKAAFTFENEGVHAYSGQAFNIKDPKILAAALAIVTVEARHASVVGLIRKGTEFGISPNGTFDKPFGASKVLKDVTSLHYIKG
ncbi:MAG: ferritin-like domain-containing protein [Solirubrobacteraceae bacterium]